MEWQVLSALAEVRNARNVKVFMPKKIRLRNELSTGCKFEHRLRV